MFVIVCRYIFRKNFVGITLFPFIILRNRQLKNNSTLMNHEKIHLVQQIELFILPFYLWYFFEYLIRLIQYKNSHKAYLNISFEREAYANEHNLNYLKKRKFYQFLHYLS